MPTVLTITRYGEFREGRVSKCSTSESERLEKAPSSLGTGLVTAAAAVVEFEEVSMRKQSPKNAKNSLKRPSS